MKTTQNYPPLFSPTTRHLGSIPAEIQNMLIAIGLAQCNNMAFVFGANPKALAMYSITSSIIGIACDKLIFPNILSEQSHVEKDINKRVALLCSIPPLLLAITILSKQVAETSTGSPLFYRQILALNTLQVTEYLLYAYIMAQRLAKPHPLAHTI